MPLHLFGIEAEQQNLQIHQPEDVGAIIALRVATNLHNYLQILIFTVTDLKYVLYALKSKME